MELSSGKRWTISSAISFGYSMTSKILAILSSSKMKLRDDYNRSFLPPTINHMSCLIRLWRPPGCKPARGDASAFHRRPVSSIADHQHFCQDRDRDLLRGFRLQFDSHW